MKAFSATALLALAPAAARAAPLSGTALWVNHAPPAAELIADAAQADAHTLIVKAAESGVLEAQFTKALVSELHAAGLSVCAWTFDYGGEPAAEAGAALGAVTAGADCLVVDAESQYDGRYAAAQGFVHALRVRLGSQFPIGLSGEAEVLEHPRFPYSVFLGPGGFNYDMPQVYWQSFGLSLPAAFAAVIPQNEIYGRPLRPVGQLYGDPGAASLEQFQALAGSYRLGGTSFFDIDEADGELLAALASGHRSSGFEVAALPTIRPGADGDEIVWAQELLNSAGARLPVGGYFGAQTARALSSFQRRHRLRPSGLLDSLTWRALLRYRAREPSWQARPPDSATLARAASRPRARRAASALQGA